MIDVEKNQEMDGELCVYQKHDNIQIQVTF